MVNNRTPYEILGVDRLSSQKEIRKRYLELCKAHHPDIAGPTSKVDFGEITVAYELLVNKKSQIIKANNNTWRYTNTTTHKPINTKLWTNRSYLVGFGILTLTFIYFYDTKAVHDAPRLLPHEIQRQKQKQQFRVPIEESTAQQNESTTPWQEAGTTFREWRKK